MLVAIPYENGEVFQHFGQTEQFALYEIKDGQAGEEKIMSTDGRSHAALADLLILWRVNAVICGDCGMRMIELLQNAQIKVYPGVTGSAKEAAEKLARGSLTPDYSAIGRCSCHDGHQD